MKIETQMIQNSIFTFKRIDEQNGSLHQHKSTFVVIDYYQGFKPPFLRLVLREFKRKNRGRFGWTTLVRTHVIHPKRISLKFTTNPRTKQKKNCYRHTIYTTKRTHLRQITKSSQLPVNKYILLDVLLCSIAEYFYELCRILTSP